jgi:hypothetical protein
MIIYRLIRKVEREIAALNERRQKLQAAAQLIYELTEQEPPPSREKQTAAAATVSRQAAVKQRKELSGKKPAGKAQQKPVAPAAAKRGQITPEGRKRIAAAQKKRWAKARKAASPASTPAKTASKMKTSAPSRLRDFHAQQAAVKPVRTRAPRSPKVTGWKVGQKIQAPMSVLELPAGQNYIALAQQRLAARHSEQIESLPAAAEVVDVIVAEEEQE